MNKPQRKIVKNIRNQKRHFVSNNTRKIDTDFLNDHQIMNFNFKIKPQWYNHTLGGVL